MTYEDTKFDLWLDKHPRVDKVYYTLRGKWMGVWRWARYSYPDWKDRRQFKPGGFFLDHGDHPCVIVRDNTDKDAVRGISLVNGTWQLSDRYHCGPEPTTQKEAQRIAEEMRAEKVVYKLDPSPMSGPTLFESIMGAKVAADKMLEEWLEYFAEHADEEGSYPLTTRLTWDMEMPKRAWPGAKEVLTAWYCKDYAITIREEKIGR